MKKTASACGKIILSGEYAVVFGHPGIAVPASLRVTVTFVEDRNQSDIMLDWDGDEEWIAYVQEIIDCCITLGSIPPGTLTVENEIPLNKGMGSSTAFVIAIAKCLLGDDCKEEALQIEDALNPGHSGIDFAVIWNEKPILFRKGSEPQVIDLSENLLKGALLIDTGTPDQATPELIAWIGSREQELKRTFEAIAACTERLRNGENLSAVMRDHNKEQQILNVVSEKGKELIKKIEQEGGSAKVIGAGGRTGGCGMVLAVGIEAASVPGEYPVIRL